MSSTTNIVKSAVTRAVIDAIDNAPNVNPSSPELKGIADSVVRDVVPVVLNQTNNEPWIQSRVLLGSFGTIVTSIFAISGLYKAGIVTGELYAPPIVAILTAGLAIYGRLVARKPIGA